MGVKKTLQGISWENGTDELDPTNSSPNYIVEFIL